MKLFNRALAAHSNRLGGRIIQRLKEGGASVAEVQGVWLAWAVARHYITCTRTAEPEPLETECP